MKTKVYATEFPHNQFSVKLENGERIPYRDRRGEIFLTQHMINIWLSDKYEIIYKKLS